MRVVNGRTTSGRGRLDYTAPWAARRRHRGGWAPTARLGLLRLAPRLSLVPTLANGSRPRPYGGFDPEYPPQCA